MSTFQHHTHTLSLSLSLTLTHTFRSRAPYYGCMLAKAKQTLIFLCEASVITV